MNIPTSIIEQQIKRGLILHSFSFEEIGHGKFFVIIGVTEEEVAGFFFINSNIHNSIWGKQELLDMQYPLKKSDYSFLRYDSYLCATKIIRKKKSEILADITNDKTTIVSEMRKEHVNDVLEKARASRLFSKIEKETFFK